MKDYYEVTIGIPLYKSFNYIVESMKTALEQTFPDIEYLIVDDCGNDGSLDIVLNLQKTHSRGKDIRIIKNDRNRGVSFCRNYIIQHSKGKYLYYMDSDDLIEPNTIQLLYDYATVNKAQVVYGSYDILDQINNRPIQKYQKTSKVIDGDGLLALYAFKNNRVFQVSVCNCLIDMSFLIQSGLRFISVSYWEDMAFTTELVSKVSKAVVLSDITYHYIWHEGSLSHNCQGNSINKNNVMNSFSVLEYLKMKSIELKDKPFMPYLCYNLEINAFYVVCYILKNYHILDSTISIFDMRDILRHPLCVVDILKFDHEKYSNLFFWLIGVLPILFFLPTIRIMGKFKNSI